MAVSLMVLISGTAGEEKCETGGPSLISHAICDANLKCDNKHLGSYTTHKHCKSPQCWNWTPVEFYSAPAAGGRSGHMVTTVSPTTW